MSPDILEFHLRFRLIRTAKHAQKHRGSLKYCDCSVYFFAKAAGINSSVFFSREKIRSLVLFVFFQRPPFGHQNFHIKNIKKQEQEQKEKEKKRNKIKYNFTRGDRRGNRT